MTPLLVTSVVGPLVGDDTSVGTVVSVRIVGEDGNIEGASEGPKVAGSTNGDAEGPLVGKEVGSNTDGGIDGASVGKAVGKTTPNGNSVGASAGKEVCDSTVIVVGRMLGLSVGKFVFGFNTMGSPPVLPSRSLSTPSCCVEPSTLSPFCFPDLDSLSTGRGPTPK